MASERKENSVLFSLKELKDLTADDPAPAPQAAPEQPAAPTRRSAFIDDTDSLLADIRGVVDEEAEAERARIEAERQAKVAAEEQARLETAALQRAEIEARLAAEKARQ